VRVAVHRAERHQTVIVLGMRFLWGLRIALPVAMGMTRMNGARFFWLNLLSAAAWSVLFALLGFSTSHVVAQLVEHLHRYELWIAGGLVAVGVLVVTLRWLNARRPEQVDGE
jgi:membrane protein DedA with SNARE-associated domain